VDVEERRKARVGTVGGLALLTGGTAVAAVAGGAHSVFATITLGLLAVGMGHALMDEIRRQATRGPAGGWVTHDTVNTLLLSSWAAAALGGAAFYPGSVRLRVVGLCLAFGYAAICAHFVALRRRTVGAPTPSTGTDTAASPTGATPLSEGRHILGR
jgi:hypothetical protein